MAKLELSLSPERLPHVVEDLGRLGKPKVRPLGENEAASHSHLEHSARRRHERRLYRGSGKLPHDLVEEPPRDPVIVTDLAVLDAQLETAWRRLRVEGCGRLKLCRGHAWPG